MTTHATPSAQRTSSRAAFDSARVGDVMRYGLIACSPEADLTDVARTMAANRVHAVVVSQKLSGDPHESWGVVSDLDVLRTAHPGGVDVLAGEAAAKPAVQVTPEHSLPRAAQLMREHETSHLIVVDGATGHPLGVISTLDIAGALASRRGEPPKW